MLNDRINGGYSFVNRRSGTSTQASSGAASTAVKKEISSKLEQIERELEELKLFNKSIRDLAEASITIIPEVEEDLKEVSGEV